MSGTQTLFSSNSLSKQTLGDSEGQDLVVKCSTLERRSAETACVEGELRHECTFPSSSPLQTNLGDKCIRRCISALTS